MRQQGRLVEWNDPRGYGFVVTHGTDQRIFVHIGQLASRRMRRPRQGDILVYEVRRDERGKWVAEAVRFARGAKQPPQHARRSGWGLVETVVTLFGLGLVMLVWSGKLPWPLAVVYPLLGTATWLVYRHDKSAASNGRWRTPESTLQLLALLGGWPGAWLAQEHLRHKSRKPSFQRGFWIMVVLNLVGLLWLGRELPPAQTWLDAFQ